MRIGIPALLREIHERDAPQGVLDAVGRELEAKTPCTRPRRLALRVWAYTLSNQLRVDEAGALQREALVLARELGDVRAEAGILQNLGQAELEAGQDDAAHATLSAARAAAVRCGDEHAARMCELVIGQVQLLRGHPLEAVVTFERLVRAFAADGDPRFAARYLLALSHHVAGRLEAARRGFTEIADELPAPTSRLEALLHLAAVDAEIGAVGEERFEALAAEISALVNVDTGRLEETWRLLSRIPRALREPDLADGLGWSSHPGRLAAMTVRAVGERARKSAR